MSLDERGTIAGPAMPVILVGSEGTDGTIISGGDVGVNELQFSPVGSHQDGPVISTAQALVNPAGATKLLIQALDQNVRFTLDGTTPTASKGFQLRAGDPPVIIPISANTTVKVIQEAATADLQYQYGS